nr:PQQ-like beta-propeller repeat protein [Pseudooceanicola onchidii]
MTFAMAKGRMAGDRMIRLAVICSVVALAACEKKETYLPGKREDVAAVLTDAPLTDDATENRVEPVSMPGATANANWPQRPGSPATRVDNAALNGALSLAWAVNIGDGDGRKARIAGDPVVADGRIFTLDSGAKVTAVTTGGAVAWTRDLAPPADGSGQASGGGLAYGGGKLFVSTGYGILSALDPATGAVLWEQDLDSSGTGTPTVAGNLVYVISGDATAWAIDVNNGRVRWQMTATPDRNTLLGGPAPAISGDLVIFGHASGEIQAVSREGGLQSWGALVSGRRRGFAKSVIGDISGDPVVSNGRVYVGVQSGSTVALDATTGERLWSANEGAMSPVWAFGGDVFLVSDLNQIVRLSAETGERVWAQDLPLFVKDKPRRQKEVFGHYGPVLAGNRLIVASGDGLLRSFDPTSGALVGQVELPGGASSNPVIAGRTLYVVSARGQLLAFR